MCIWQYLILGNRRTYQSVKSDLNSHIYIYIIVISTLVFQDAYMLNVEVFKILNFKCIDRFVHNFRKYIRQDIKYREVY